MPSRCERKTRKEALANIRNHLASFGFDTSEYTDEELEEGIRRLQVAMRQSGVSVKDAGKALRSVIQRLDADE